MIARAISSLVVALGFAAMAAGDDGPALVKTELRHAQGAIVRTFKDEQLVEVKIERVFAKEGETPRPEERKRDREPGAPPPLYEGQVVFLHVVDASVFDESGVEQVRDDKRSWLSRDRGWAALKEGKRIRIDYDRAYLVPAPRGFPEEARAGGELLVYHVVKLYLLDPRRI
ncbi:MAG TPA: hypothetical protein VFF73_01765 [Planctomycetota bacterium]|nr:hypothetical protein [Planctomycetota bacterium]